MGEKYACPPVFYHTTGTSKTIIDETKIDEVFMYFSGSRSGKTLELACSSFTRGAHISFLVSELRDDNELKKAQKRCEKAWEYHETKKGKRDDYKEAEAERTKCAKEFCVMKSKRC